MTNGPLERHDDSTGSKEPGTGRGRVTGLVVTSDCCPPETDAAELAIVSMVTVIDGVPYHDSELSAARCLEIVGQSSGPVTTSLPSPGEFIEAIRRLDAQDVLVLTATRRFSGSYSSACLAARICAEESDLPVSVRVLDTQSAVAGTGLLVRLALQTAADGARIEAVERRVRRAMPQVWLAGALHVRDSIHRSQRLPAFALKMAASIDRLPAFALTSKRISLLGVPKKSEAVSFLAECTAKRLSGQPASILIFHVGELESAQQLAGCVDSNLKATAIEIASLSSTVASQTGPGVIGIAALPAGSA